MRAPDGTAETADALLSNEIGREMGWGDRIGHAGAWSGHTAPVTGGEKAWVGQAKAAWKAAACGCPRGNLSQRRRA